MKWRIPFAAHKWLIVLPIVAGVAILALLVASREGPGRRAEREAIRTLRVIHAPRVDVVPRAIGYGTARPGQTWRAVAQVKGHVVEVHPELESGAMVSAGETLLRIDPTEYELAVAQFEAEIAQVSAQLSELDVQEANDRASLEIEESSLALAQRELERLETLRERNAASDSDVDQQTRTLLTQRQLVQKLRNSLQLVPERRQSLEATLAVKQAGLRQAKLDLAKTEVEAPFDCRLGEVDIETGQYLTAGQSLFEAHGTALAEVEVQVPMDQLRPLVDRDHDIQLPINMDSQVVQRLFDFEVIVRFQSGDFRVQWEGRVVRMREQLDPRTRTVALVVAVEKPYAQAIPGQRPPLIQGMFCEAELRGQPRPGRVVIPRAALHSGGVYVVDENDRLRRREVEVAFTQSAFACLTSGVEEGERLVVSDPTPAIEGLLVEAVVDEPLQERLVAQATRGGSLK